MTTLSLLDSIVRGWQQILFSPWALLCAATACIILVFCVQRRPRAITVRQPLPEAQACDLDKTSIQDSPFLAFLGHNVVTESIAQDPVNTSIHAIHRIPEHIKFTDVIPTLTAEPQPYDFERLQEGPGDRQWRSHSYPDSPNRQVSFGSVQQMRDEKCCRQWSRRTIQVCGI